MNRYFLSAIAGTLCCCTLFSQNESDALRYSFTGFGGTARYCSMGGAFGALGADLSTLTTNPAGLGLYRKNELTFTPVFLTQRVNSTYNGTMASDSRYKFQFNNFGFAFTGKTDNTSDQGWQTVTLGIAYNRYNTFESNLSMSGNANTSLMDSWAKTAGGSGPGELDPFNEGLGWNTWMLNTVPGDSLHYTDTIPAGDLLAQQKTVTRRGGMGEWDFGVGGNYSNKLYLGASIGIVQANYEENSTYSETEVNDTVSAFQYFQLEQSLTTHGHGVNVHLGLIYRPIDMVRVGFAFTSPTLLRMSDTYYSKMGSKIGGTEYDDASPNGQYSYTITTPMRVMGSLGIIFGKKGLLSADYEYVNYADARLSASDYTFSTENNNIQNKYTSGQNIHVGGEYRLDPFSLRAGMAMYSNPFSPAVNNDGSQLYITGGFGYHNPDDSFYIDLAVVTATKKDNYYFYDSSMVNPVSNTWKSVSTMLTVGFRY